MITQSPLATVILAAGKGTRMKSPRAKVLHEVFYEPMVHHVLKAVAPLNAVVSIVIIGHQKERVEEALTGFNVNCVEQKEQNGTGHAVLAAEDALRTFEGNVMILCGDSPLLCSENLEAMMQSHAAAETALTIMTTTLENPTNYGRILKDDSGSVLAVVEEKDATAEQRTIKEINAGIYCADKHFLFEALKEITTDNAQGEMYLTDIVEIATRKNVKVNSYRHPVPDHVLGVNSRIELAQAHSEIQHRRNRALLADGITMHSPASISISPTVKIAPDCILTQQITITGSSTIGYGCTIEPGVSISNCCIGDRVIIGANSVLNNCSIESDIVVPALTAKSGA